MCSKTIRVASLGEKLASGSKLSSPVRAHAVLLVLSKEDISELNQKFYLSLTFL